MKRQAARWRPLRAAAASTPTAGASAGGRAPRCRAASVVVCVTAAAYHASARQPTQHRFAPARDVALNAARVNTQAENADDVIAAAADVCFRPPLSSPMLLRRRAAAV
jgi:hypothetical protein